MPHAVAGVAVADGVGDHAALWTVPASCWVLKSDKLMDSLALIWKFAGSTNIRLLTANVLMTPAPGQAFQLKLAYGGAYK